MASPPYPEAQYSPAATVPTFPITTVLVGLNVLVFAAMVFTGVSPTNPSLDQLLKWGADFGPLTLDRQWWRLITSAFVHGSIFHIGFNMWAFWNLGRLAERIFGKWTYLLIYLFTAVSASLVSLFFHPTQVSVGASGAIFGVAGALITALYLGKLPIPKPAVSATLRSLVAFAGYNLFFGAVVAHIDNFAHLGGFLLGLIAGALLSRTLHQDADARGPQVKIIFTVLAVALVVFGMYVKLSRASVVLAQRVPAAAYSQYLAGTQYLSAKDFKNAEPRLKTAVELAPNFLEAWEDLSYVHLQLHRFPEVVSDCQRALALNANDAIALENLGTAYLELKQYDNAINALYRGVHAAPQLLKTWLDLGDAFLYVGDYGHAIEAYQGALKVNPESPRGLKGLKAAQDFQLHPRRNCTLQKSETGDWTRQCPW